VRHLSGIRQFVIAAACCVAGSVAIAKTPEKPVEIVLSPYLGTTLRTMQARVGGKERSFLLDTGGGGTFLSKVAAGEMQVEVYGRSTGFTHDARRIDLPKAGPLDVSVGTFTRHGEVGVFDLESILPGPSLGGILSLETFANHAITLDLAANRLWIETPESFAARTKGAHELQARVERQAGGLSLDIFIAVQGKHGPLWFELDSGNVAPVLIAPHAFTELGLDPIPANGGRTVKLDIAGLGPTDCAATSKEMIYDGLFNAQFFLDHIVTFDLTAGRVWVASRKAS
jgi:hypothetical protein